MTHRATEHTYISFKQHPTHTLSLICREDSPHTQAPPITRHPHTQSHFKQQVCVHFFISHSQGGQPSHSSTTYHPSPNPNAAGSSTGSTAPPAGKLEFLIKSKIKGNLLEESHRNACMMYVV